MAIPPLAEQHRIVAKLKKPVSEANSAVFPGLAGCAGGGFLLPAFLFFLLLTSLRDSCAGIVGIRAKDGKRGFFVALSSYPQAALAHTGVFKKYRCTTGGAN